ncbi:MAG: YhbY family RNA-binding protein [Candidatus Enteromonas sp.]
MLKPYQKAYLKSLANSIDHRHLLGKGELDDSFLGSLDAALEANELIKVSILPSSGSKAKDVGKALEEKLNADVVQIIGRVIVLYRRSVKHPKIEVPCRKEDR